MQIGSINSIDSQLVTATNKATPMEVTNSFSNYLSDAIKQVNQAQITSQVMGQKLATGEIQDVHQVTIAGQQATVMLDLAVQVRNKVIESYQEIMRMPL